MGPEPIIFLTLLLQMGGDNNSVHDNHVSHFMYVFY